MLSSRLLALGAVALSSCSSGPPIATEDPPAAIDLGARLLADGEDQAALTVLGSIAEDALVGKDLERYRLYWAQSLYATGSSWTAYKVIRNYAEDFRFSDYGAQIEELHFKIGIALIKSDSSRWIFGSDRDDGVIVLSEFVQRYGSNQHVPEALKLLGDAAFDEKRYFVARDRYNQILTDFPKSEWAAVARFRNAISAFLALVGPQYNMAKMELAGNELRHYIELNPERPEFLKEARDALATVERWLAERQLMIANFYKTIGNRDGEVYHLEVLVKGYPDSEPAKRADTRLEEMAAAAAGDDGEQTER